MVVSYLKPEIKYLVANVFFIYLVTS